MMRFDAATCAVAAFCVDACVADAATASTAMNAKAAIAKIFFFPVFSDVIYFFLLTF